MGLEKSLNAQERVIENKLSEARSIMKGINNSAYLKTINSVLELWESYAKTPGGFDHALELYKNSIVKLIEAFEKR